MRCVSKSFACVMVAVLCFAACSHFKRAEPRITVDLKAANYPAGLAEAEFDKTLSLTGELVKLDLTTTYYPLDDAVCLKFRHDFTTYYQFWDKANRAAFVAALRAYKTEYEQRSLIDSYMRTKRQYNTVRAYLIWETSNYSLQAANHPNIEIGYQFRNNAPYFALTMREEANEETTVDMINASPNLVMYFTRAQADMLASIFDAEFLGQLGPVPARAAPPVPAEEEQPADPYTEAEL